MHPKFKPHVQSLGNVFYLDVTSEDNVKYLNKKTTDAANCIVGKHEGWSLTTNRSEKTTYTVLTLDQVDIFLTRPLGKTF